MVTLVTIMASRLKMVALYNSNVDQQTVSCIQTLIWIWRPITNPGVSLWIVYINPLVLELSFVLCHITVWEVRYQAQVPWSNYKMKEECWRKPLLVVWQCYYRTSFSIGGRKTTNVCCLPTFSTNLLILQPSMFFIWRKSYERNFI